MLFILTKCGCNIYYYFTLNKIYDSEIKTYIFVSFRNTANCFPSKKERDRLIVPIFDFFTSYRFGDAFQVIY